MGIADFTRRKTSRERRGQQMTGRQARTPTRASVRQLRRAAPFILPYIVFLLVFSVYPVAQAIVMTFYDWPPIGERRFIGLENYAAMVRDPVFWRSFANVIQFLVINLVGVVLFAILLGVAFNQRLPLIGLFRTACFSPSVVSLLVISIVWSWLYSPIGGPLNYLLSQVGIAPQLWLSSPGQAMPAIAVLNIWRGAGFYGIIVLTGLQSIPPEVLEASALDGANRWQTFWRVTLPLLLPTVELVIVLATIFGLLLFTEPYVMTQGGPLNRTMTPAYYMYVQGFQFWKLGYASAIGLALMALVFGFTLLERRFIGRRIDY